MITYDFDTYMIDDIMDKMKENPNHDYYGLS